LQNIAISFCGDSMISDDITDDITGDFLGLINVSEIYEKNQKGLTNLSLNSEVVEVIRALRLRKETDSDIKEIKKMKCY
jgi:hypothetical protein